MKHMLQICCKNNNISKEFPIGSSLLDIYYGFNLNFPYQVVSAKVNNRSEGLNFRVYNNKDVEFLDIRDSSGMRTYVRSLCFILYKAVSELFPEGKLFVEHPVSKGYFCNLRIGRPIELEDVAAIKKRMQEIIAENIPPPCRMPHHRGCTHLQRTGHERQSEAAGNFRLAIYLLLHTGRHRRLLLRQPVAQYRIHLAVRYREVLRRPAATHPQPGKPRCPGRSGETRENARRIQGTPALELHYGTGQRRRLQHGLRGRPCHRPHQRGRSPAGKKR